MVCIPSCLWGMVTRIGEELSLHIELSKRERMLLAVFRILDQGFVDNIGVSYIVASQAAGVS
jgi:hypothetical protein